MGSSIAKALTDQFYQWERWGRGWQLAEYSCDLEPPFVPFFGHFVEDDTIIDDGKIPHWLDRLFGDASHKQPVVKNGTELVAYPFDGETDLTTFIIRLPKTFRQGLERIEQFLIMLSYRKSPVSFELIADCETVTVQWVCRETDARFVSAQLHAYFPDCTIMQSDGDVLLDALQTFLPLYTVDFGLQEEFMRPLAMQSPSDTDAYTALFGVIEYLSENEYVIVQMLFSGTHNAWSDSIMTAVCDNNRKQSFFLDAPEMPQLAKEKVSRPLYGATMRVVTMAEEVSHAGLLLQHVATALIHASKGNSNALLPLSDQTYTVEQRLIDIVNRETRRVGMLINSKELAVLVHLPTVQLSPKLLGQHGTTKAAPDVLCGYEYEFGVNEYQGIKRIVSLPPEQRLKHMHILGATGTGKSTFLHSLIMQDIVQGNGCCVVDPHGDLIEAIISSIPEDRCHDVILIDPSDSSYPIAFNILVAYSDLEKDLLASDLAAIFKRFSTSWGDQMNSVFANTIMAFVYNTLQYHLGDLRRFLIEASYRTTILQTVTEPDIVYYWQKEFPILKGGSVGSILTRLDSFLRPKAIRSMVCQDRSVNFAELMDSKKIVLVKLSQGLLGTENSYLLGAFIVSKLQQIAMSRQAQAAHTRVPFYLYLDEFHNFITPSMASILSGARKYGVGLVLAHQDIAQIQKYDAEVATSVLSNAGTRVCFRLGDTDAKRMQDGFSGFSADDLQNLTTGEAIARVNTANADFNLSVIPYNNENDTDYTETIITHSRHCYSVPIQPLKPIVEEPIMLEVTQPPAPLTPNAKQKAPTKSNTHGSERPQQEREHVYLQMFIKKMAEEHGYTAQLEVKTPDGHGQVDILLEKDSQVTAVEISVTTTAPWELHNIQKCIAASYHRIVVCANNPSKLTKIQELLQQSLSTQQLNKIQFVTPDTIHGLFVHTTGTKNTDTVIKGYRVKVQYADGGVNKQDLLKNIIASTKKP